MRVLIVDDDEPVAEFVRAALQGDGVAADVALDLSEAEALVASHPYRAAVLDVNLPDGTGFDFVERMRGRGFSAPVLLLTARRETEDVVRGLDAGADDFLSKPFAVEELTARVRALLRRGGPARDETVRCGDLVLDRLGHVIARGDRKLRLTPKEYALLEYFLLHPGRVVTRPELLQQVWDLHFDPGSNVVDTHVARLRGKLSRNGVTARLKTVRGAGFMLTGGE